jgi:hypothetical protein
LKIEEGASRVSSKVEFIGHANEDARQRGLFVHFLYIIRSMSDQPWLGLALP